MALTNAKHERFCVEYVVDHNATQAAIRAGYSEHTAASQASRLLTNVGIKSRIAELDQAVVESVIGSAAWIVQKAVEVIDIGLATVPVKGRDGKVIEDKDGNPEFYEAHNLAAVNGALKLLATRHKEFSEKHDVEHSGAVSLVRKTRGLNGR